MDYTASEFKLLRAELNSWRKENVGICLFLFDLRKIHFANGDKPIDEEIPKNIMESFKKIKHFLENESILCKFYIITDIPGITTNEYCVVSGVDNQRYLQTGKTLPKVQSI